jgi:hypothetical protein
MDSRVSSRLSAKRYETTLNEVFEEDINFKTYLYKVDIFGHNLIIAPGKVIYDTDIEDLVYSYVYAVQNDRPVMKLGVYEKIVENKDMEVFNLEEFKEGSMLLFEYYETNPTKIAELETTEQAENDSNPFELIIENVFTPASDISKFYESKESVTYTKDVFNHLHTQYKKLKDEAPKEFIKILNHILKEIRGTFGTGKDMKFNLSTIEFMKTYSGNRYDEKFSICLAILASFLKVRFIVMNSAGNIYNDTLNLNINLAPYGDFTHYVVLRNYDIYYKDEIQPFGPLTEEHDTKVNIQVFKAEELPTYLKAVMQNVPEEEAVQEEIEEPLKMSETFKEVDLNAESKEKPVEVDLNAESSEKPVEPNKTKLQKPSIKLTFKTKPKTASEK